MTVATKTAYLTMNIDIFIGGMILCAAICLSGLILTKKMSPALPNKIYWVCVGVAVVSGLAIIISRLVCR